MDSIPVGSASRKIRATLYMEDRVPGAVPCSSDGFLLRHVNREFEVALRSDIEVPVAGIFEVGTLVRPF